MKKILTYSAVLVALAVLGVLVAASAEASPHHLVALHVQASVPVRAVDDSAIVDDSALVARQINHLRRGVVWHRSKTWYWQNLAGVPRSPTNYPERRWRSVPALRWLYQRWSKGRVYSRKLAHSPLPTTRDWMTAVNIVQHSWPGTRVWMLSCSGGEGGHGAWIPNSQGSPAGGWMQFYASTFYSTYDSAIRSARQLHRRLPPANARNWYSALGQAFAAGWARLHADYNGPGLWDSRVDSACA